MKIPFCLVEIFLGIVFNQLFRVSNMVGLGILGT